MSLFLSFNARTRAMEKGAASAGFYGSEGRILPPRQAKGFCRPVSGRHLLEVKRRWGGCHVLMLCTFHLRSWDGWGTWIRTKIDGVRVRFLYITVRHPM